MNNNQNQETLFKTQIWISLWYKDIDYIYESLMTLPDS